MALAEPSKHRMVTMIVVRVIQVARTYEYQSCPVTSDTASVATVRPFAKCGTSHQPWDVFKLAVTQFFSEGVYI